MSVQIFLVALAGLAVIVVASVFSRRTGIATPLVLVAIGIGASFVPGVPEVPIPPEWVLSGVLPPLLYADAVKLPVIDLRRNLPMITWLSVVLVVGTALTIGAVVHLLFGLPLALGVALGAVVSPTDAVAATSIGKRLGLPSRLMTILEGESLVNDASALVLLRTAVAALAGGFSVVQALGGFASAVVIGVVIGLAAGWVTVWIRSRLDDPVLTTAISFVVPFIAFVPTEALGASGVLAVVVAGLVTGHRGVKQLTARDRQTEATNWATISFLLENAVFLVMGLELTALLSDLTPEADGTGSRGQVLMIAAVVLGLLVVLRLVGVAVPLLMQGLNTGKIARDRAQLAAATERLESRTPTTERESSRIEWFRRRLARGNADTDFAESNQITARGGLVLGWAGMRGVVTLAAAQSIEEGTAYRSTVVLVAFVVAVATLVLFGGTLPWLIRRVDFEEVSFDDQREEFGRLAATLLEQVRHDLGAVEDQQVDGQPVDPQAIESLMHRFGPLLSAPERGGEPPKPGVREQAIVLQRRYLQSLQTALLNERSIGAYSTEALARMQRILDREEFRLDTAG